MHPALQSLQAFTARESLDITLLADPRPEETAYPPLAQYVLELSRRAKPETAADGLFQAVARDVIRTGFLPQVHVGYGFVDYLLTDTNGAVALELKPLFHRYNDDELRPSTLKPSQHLLQVKKYLHQHEYVILTDLKDAYLFSARDTLVDGSHFARLPFTELLDRQLETGSFLDVLRRLEDNIEKPGLDRQFFADLRDWYRVFERVQFLPGADAPGLIILLINKLVFVKTLEDYGLIAYRFLQNEYERLKELWDPKGPHRTLPNYLKILDADEFLEVFYDTELFSRAVWPHVERSPANIALLASSLEKVLGVARWDQVFSRGVVHYNYRRINEDIFGRSYEMFLAANRKDEGIYYTPAAVTVPMADGLADRLFGPAVDEICACVAPARCDFARAGVLMDGIAQIRVADTAAGSGGFLIKVLRAVWRQYERLDAASSWVNKLAPPTADGSFLDAPPGVQQAREFRARYLLDTPRNLLCEIASRYSPALPVRTPLRSIFVANVCREIVRLMPEQFQSRLMVGDTAAFECFHVPIQSCRNGPVLLQEAA